MAVNILLKRSSTANKRPTAAQAPVGELILNYDSATGGLFYQDSGAGIIKVGPAQVGAAAPNATPVGSSGNTPGEFWYDTANSTLKVWTGSAWASAGTPGAVTSVTGTAPITVNNTTPTTPIIGIQDATGAQKGVVQIGANITVAAGVISIANATSVIPGVVTVGTNIQVTDGAISVLSSSTTQPGVVQLNDTVTSTSVVQALTANQGKLLQDQIDTLTATSNLTLAGTINGTNGQMVTVTTAGTAESFSVGAVMPAAAAGNDGYFAIVTTSGTFTPPGGASTSFNAGDWVLSNGTAYERLAVGFSGSAATTTTSGLVELATNAEVQAGDNTTVVVTPSGLQSKLSDSTATTSSTTIASSTAVKAAYDLADAAVPKNVLTAAGSMLYASAASTPAELAVGTTGQVMVVNGAGDAPDWTSTIDGGAY